MDISFNKPGKKPASRPKALVCYICGREYGTRSLEIHIKTCEKKWEIEQDQRPPKAKRRPCPQPPPGFVNMVRAAQGKKPLRNQEPHLNGDLCDMMNPKEVKLNRKAQLDPHQAIAQYNDQAFKNWDQNVLDPCPHCRRTFLPEKLKFHLKGCKAGKPLKKPLVRDQGSGKMEESKVQNLGLAAREAAAARNAKTLRNQYGLKKPTQLYQTVQPQQLNANWRQEHQKFRQAVRLGKQIDALEKDPKLNTNVALQTRIHQLADQVPSQEKDMKQCPHCRRTFNLQAAVRHIPACKNTFNKPKPPPTREDLIRKQQIRRSKSKGY